MKAAMVERVIRILKNKMYKHFTANRSWDWINHMSKFVPTYL